MSKKRFSIEENPDGNYVFHLVIKATGKGHLSDLWVFNERWRGVLIKQMQRFLGLYGGIKLIGFQCMSNHLHLLVWIDRKFKRNRDEMAAAYNSCYPNASITPNEHICRKLQSEQADIGKFMGRFEHDFARKFNLSCKFKRTGHLWSEAYHCTQITDQIGLLRCWTYILMNTVKAGMTDNPLKDAYNSLTFNLKKEAPWLEQIMDNFHSLWLELSSSSMTKDEFKDMLMKLLQEALSAYQGKNEEQKIAWQISQTFWTRACIVGAKVKMELLGDKIPWRLREEESGEMLWA